MERAATLAMPTFSHRPSFTQSPRSHERDRAVWYDGVHVGRAYHEVTAHRGHKWQWSALAETGHDAIGEADTLEEALELIRTACLASMERWPNLLEETRAMQKKVRESHNAWLRVKGKPEVLD